MLSAFLEHVGDVVGEPAEADILLVGLVLHDGGLPVEDHALRVVRGAPEHLAQVRRDPIPRVRARRQYRPVDSVQQGRREGRKVLAHELALTGQLQQQIDRVTDRIDLPGLVLQHGAISSRLPSASR